MKNKVKLFINGLTDSLSLNCFRIILSNHKSSKILITTIFNTIKQVLLFYVILPELLGYLSQYTVIFKIAYYIVLGMTTVGTYGQYYLTRYTFFYFKDMVQHSQLVIKYLNDKELRKQHKSLYILQLQQKQSILRIGSAALKSTIFLVTYILLYLCLSALLTQLPTIGIILMVLSQSFFNGVFFFLRKWPYDKYNLAFFQIYFPYFFGYGLIISVISNLVFSGIKGNAAYFLLTPFYIVNCLSKQPKYFDSLGNQTKEGAYNIHRKKLNQSQNYQQRVKQEIKIFWVVLKITQWINTKLQNFLEKK